ncbi:hypothetical protein L5515_004983 [Caenorhabditis briggsae]|uniref:Uncharacterized protein n=1 Tax=Caenorhabditis briggsae TaxID=6238 RepID=A0AAE9ERH1_CAEBR|nr:hypothetical protein L5515_004983 [Caenorhabditis briggsae]
MAFTTEMMVHLYRLSRKNSLKLSVAVDLMVEIMREGRHPRHREVLEGFLNGELRDYGEAVEHRLRQLMKSNRPANRPV